MQEFKATKAFEPWRVLTGIRGFFLRQVEMGHRVLVLDDSTANHDPYSEELVREITQQLDVIKILVSPEMDIISMLCERTMVMQKGQAALRLGAVRNRHFHNTSFKQTVSLRIGLS